MMVVCSWLGPGGESSRQPAARALQASERAQVQAHETTFQFVGRGMGVESAATCAESAEGKAEARVSWPRPSSNDSYVEWAAAGDRGWGCAVCVESGGRLALASCLFFLCGMYPSRPPRSSLVCPDIARRCKMVCSGLSTATVRE